MRSMVEIFGQYGKQREWKNFLSYRMKLRGLLFKHHWGKLSLQLEDMLQINSN